MFIFSSKEKCHMSKNTEKKRECRENGKVFHLLKTKKKIEKSKSLFQEAQKSKKRLFIVNC